MTTARARGARRLLPVVCALAAAALALAWWAASGGRPEARGAQGARATRGASAAPASLAEHDDGMGLAATGNPARARSAARGAESPEQVPASSEPQATEIVVIDERDAPLAGATVRVAEGEPAGEWTTDGDGRVRLPSAPEPGSIVLLVAEKPGYVHLVKRWEVAPQGFVRLYRAIPLGGTVTDGASGAGVAGARVELEHRRCDGCAPDVATTDGTGVYRLEAAPAGFDVRLWVSAEGYVEDRSRFRTDADGHTAQHDLVLERGLPVALRVVDAATGAPVAGAAVRGAEGSFSTDDLGLFASDQLVELGEERARITVTAEGYCRLRLRPTAREVSERSEWVLPLVRTAALEVRVIDAAGRAGVAEVELGWSGELEHEARSAPAELAALLEGLPRWSLGPDGPRVTEAGAGAGLLEGLPPHLAALTVTATAADGAHGSATVAVPGPGETGVAVLRLAEPGLVDGPATIRGRLTLGGEPEQGRVVWHGAALSGHGQSGKDGRFVLEGVEPGPVTLTAQSDRVLARSTCALGQLAPLELFVRVGEQREQDLALDLALAPVAGRVTEVDGRPAAGVEVEVRDPGRCWRERVLTDDEGRFEVAVPAELPAYQVRVTRAPEELRRDHVPPGSAGVDFVLSALGRLRFRVTDTDDGSAVPRGVIEWRRPGGRHEELVDFGRLVPDPGGWYEVPCVAGELDLTASTARDRHVPRMLQRVRIPAGGIAEVEFELRPSLTRRLVLEEGSIPPPAGFAAVLVPESLADRVDYTLDPRPHWAGLGKRGPFAELRFKAGGVARARGLKPGPYRILVWPPSVRVAPERLKLRVTEPEATVRLRLAWR